MFSLAELLLTLLVILIFINPKDLPEIAHFLGRVFYRSKRMFNNFKKQFKEIESEFGINNLKQEMQRGIAEEKSKIEDEITVIVDIYGNEHLVPNIKDLRPDLDEKNISAEVSTLNEKNAPRDDYKAKVKSIEDQKLN